MLKHLLIHILINKTLVNTYNSDMKKIFNKNIIIIVLTFLIPGLIAFIIRDSFSTYKLLARPRLSPPGIIFPIVWNILYLLMSISVILVKEKDRNNLKIYYIQIILNALWSPIFFVLKNYLLALIELNILLITVLFMFYKFCRESKVSGYLLIPYLIWLIYAMYLNYYVYLYN